MQQCLTSFPAVSKTYRVIQPRRTAATQHTGQKKKAGSEDPAELIREAKRLGDEKVARPSLPRALHPGHPGATEADPVDSKTTQSNDLAALHKLVSRRPVA